MVSIEVLAKDRGYAEQTIASVRRLSVERKRVSRTGASFSAGPFGEQTAGPIAFHPRPQLRREDVILPTQTFAAIEEHVFGIAAHRERLRASGQHLKWDLTFLLTTNRADVLEPALAARPGRVDEAVEIALPDSDGRHRLLDLYGAGVEPQLADPSAIIERTEGVTASFIKELVRKSALIAAAADHGHGRLTVTDGHVSQALDALLHEGAGLTRALLGIARDTAEAQAGPAAPPSAAGWFAYAPLGRPPRAMPLHDC